MSEEYRAEIETETGHFDMPGAAQAQLPDFLCNRSDFSGYSCCMEAAGIEMGDTMAFSFILKTRVVVNIK